MLKPCPFCDEIPVIVNFSDDDEPLSCYDIICGTPGCFLEFGGGWRINKVYEIKRMWNDRVRPDEVI